MKNIRKGEKIPKPTSSQYVVVRRSKIHGTGIYAKKDISKGTNVIEYVGYLITKKEADDIADRELENHNKNSENGAVYIFDLNKKQDVNGNVSWNTAKWINHSCDPNCETEGDDDSIWIQAIGDIKKGAELTYDYCYDLDSYESHLCKCGSKNCIGYIVGEKHRKKLQKILAKK